MYIKLTRVLRKLTMTRIGFYGILASISNYSITYREVDRKKRRK